jgi:hypothetical protein
VSHFLKALIAFLPASMFFLGFYSFVLSGKVLVLVTSLIGAACLMIAVHTHVCEALVADRENGRIEEFDLDGKLLGKIPKLGRTYSLKLGANGTLWAGMQPLNEPPGSSGWVVKLDRKSGKILGYVPVRENADLHTVEDTGDGQPMTAIGNRFVWFKKRSLRSVQ